MSATSLLLLSLVVTLSQAYNTGAPSLTGPMAAVSPSCKMGSARPLHALPKPQAPTAQGATAAPPATNTVVMPQHTAGPYKLAAYSANKPYGPGSRVTVTLSGPANRPFKGFFITGYADDAPAGLQGTWTAAPGTQANETYFCSKGITHTDASPKTTVQVYWSPPTNFTHGRVQFKATVVESYAKFYTSILSNSITAVTTVDTQTVHSQKKMKEMMRGFSNQMAAVRSRFASAGAGTGGGMMGMPGLLGMTGMPTGGGQAGAGAGTGAGMREMMAQLMQNRRGQAGAGAGTGMSNQPGGRSFFGVSG